MRTVKHTFVIALLMLTSLVGFAQSKSDRLYDTFQNKDGVMYFAFTKNMTDAFNIDLDDKGKSIHGDLQEIRFMSYNPKQGKFPKSYFVEKSASLLPSGCRLVETDEADGAKIWMLGNRKKAREFHIQVGGDTNNDLCFWISFYGDFQIDDLEGVKAIGRELADD